MPGAEDLRRAALALPGTTEQSHHGFPSFRTKKRIFATLPDEGHAHLMLDPEPIREAVALDPAACAEKWWGAKLAALRVDLAAIPPEALADLLREAWERAR